MEVEVKTVVGISSVHLVESMTMTELAEFCSAAAEKLNDDFKLRSKAAENFAEGLSENGCRFLAEVVTQHYRRNSAR
jgi:hypothetical protein